MNVHQIAPGHWRVDSESREGVQYDVHQDGAHWTCSCPQNAILHRCCKHLAEVWSFVKHGPRCPACHGKGIIRITSFVWYEETGERSTNELPCAICEGAGRLRSRPCLPSEEDTRRIFA